MASMKQLREDVEKDYKDIKQKELESGPKASYGYGGKFGVQQDRMDQVGGKLCITLLHLEKPNLYAALVFLSAIGLNQNYEL